MGIRTAALTVAILLATPALHAATPPGQGAPASTARDHLVEHILEKWANHVEERYGTSLQDWAREMTPAFARASDDALSAAASATTFDEMGQRLLATAPSMRAMNEALASAPGTNALGDAANDLVFVPVTPCRILDTRLAGGAIPADSARNFDLTSTGSYVAQGGAANDCGVGAAGAFAAAVINFTVVNPSSAGFVTAYPFDTARPLAATLNYAGGDVRGNLSVVRLNQASAGAEFSVYSFAQTHLVADVMGYYINPQATPLNCANTSVSSFSLPANSVNFFNNPSCPAGYTATTPYCWTAASGVYSQGSGYNANAAGNATFCSWQNTTGASQTVFGGNVCCRVPGR
ncbi:hypothetical protein [Arenimonas sp.]|uniref:hypothetical protein n=1 Tax=Arenimonas sp. TaxID=1872635 RepID=UPI002E3089C0|nr:hypothetical protein [Arenimonas sp.]HEX4853105.1 hypothetical protein [Arenimonas sp.]